MKTKFSHLLKKEYFITVRDGGILEMLVYGSSFTFLLCILVRYVPDLSNSLVEILLPAFWTLYVTSIFRFFLKSNREEIEKGIFYSQLLLGVSETKIFYSKLITGILVSLLLLYSQAFILVFLLAIPDLTARLFAALTYCSIAIPCLAVISELCAIISISGNKAEVIMPIISFPLLILLSTATLQISESVFLTGSFNDAEYWLKLILGLSIILLLFAPRLFKFLITGIGRKI